MELLIIQDVFKVGFVDYRNDRSAYVFIYDFIVFCGQGRTAIKQGDDDIGQ